MLRRSLLFLIIIAFSAVVFHFINKTEVPSPANAQVCSIKPVDVVLVIDRSGSMSDPGGSCGNKLQCAKRAARSFIDILDNDPRNHVGLASYASFGSVDHGLTGGSQTEYNRVKTAITNLSAAGNTCIECGIFRANRAISNGGRSGATKVVILLTDGLANVTQASQPTVVGQTQAENAALAEARNSYRDNGTIFYTIGLGNAPNINPSFLRDIKDVGAGGRYFPSPDGDDLEIIYRQIAEEISALGSISGFVYEDINPANGVRDPGDPGLAGWTIVLTNPDGSTSTAISQAPDGRYTFPSLCNGSYNVTQVVQPGFDSTNPGGYTLNINNNQLFNINFGNRRQGGPTPTADKWIHSIGGDIREDHGNIFDPNIIQGATNYFSQAGPRMTHGVVFLKRPFDLDPGTNESLKANTGRWLVENTKFTPNSIKTNYFLVRDTLRRGGIVFTQLFGSGSPPCGSSLGPNCNLNTNLAGGVYIWENSNVNLTAPSYTFRINPTGSNNYTFLIKGDLYIRGNIIAPPGTTVIFIVGGKITVASNVTTVEGIFSSDNNFTVETAGPGADEQLKINGSVIANAALKDRLSPPQSHGTFAGGRDLGAGNETQAGVVVRMRPDFILNSPQLIRTGNFNRVEVAPGE